MITNDQFLLLNWLLGWRVWEGPAGNDQHSASRSASPSSHLIYNSSVQTITLRCHQTAWKIPIYRGFPIELLPDLTGGYAARFKPSQTSPASGGITTMCPSKRYTDNRAATRKGCAQATRQKKHIELRENTHRIQSIITSKWCCEHAKIIPSGYLT
jgi:hypothetical protein